MARTGRALGNGKRLELLDLLAQVERSVQELAEVAELNLTTASAHLQAFAMPAWSPPAATGPGSSTASPIPPWPPSWRRCAGSPNNNGPRCRRP